MWFKYINKEMYKLRLFRHHNLRFHHNNEGTQSFLYEGKLSSAYNRIWGSQLSRMFNMVLFVSVFGMYTYYKESRYGEENRKKAKEAEKKLEEDELKAIQE